MKMTKERQLALDIAQPYIERINLLLEQGCHIRHTKLVRFNHVPDSDQVVGPLTLNRHTGKVSMPVIVFGTTTPVVRVVLNLRQDSVYHWTTLPDTDDIRNIRRLFTRDFAVFTPSSEWWV